VAAAPAVIVPPDGATVALPSPSFNLTPIFVVNIQIQIAIQVESLQYTGCIVTSPNDAHSPVGPARRQGGRSPGRPRPGLFCVGIWRAILLDKFPAAVTFVSGMPSVAA
jgi:hypothetical protein